MEAGCTRERLDKTWKSRFVIRGAFATERVCEVRLAELENF